MPACSCWTAQMRWTEQTLSWRITEPLRRANHWRRERQNGNGAGPQ